MRHGQQTTGHKLYDTFNHCVIWLLDACNPSSLHGVLVQMSSAYTIEEGCQQIKGANEQASFEVLRLKKIKINKNGLKVWNTDTKMAIKEKVKHQYFLI